MNQNKNTFLVEKPLGPVENPKPELAKVLAPEDQFPGVNLITNGVSATTLATADTRLPGHHGQPLLRLEKTHAAFEKKPLIDENVEHAELPNNLAAAHASDAYHPTVSITLAESTQLPLKNAFTDLSAILENNAQETSIFEPIASDSPAPAAALPEHAPALNPETATEVNPENLAAEAPQPAAENPAPEVDTPENLASPAAEPQDDPTYFSMDDLIIDDSIEANLAALAQDNPSEDLLSQKQQAFDQFLHETVPLSEADKLSFAILQNQKLLPTNVTKSYADFLSASQAPDVTQIDSLLSKGNSFVTELDNFIEKQPAIMQEIAQQYPQGSIKENYAAIKTHAEEQQKLAQGNFDSESVKYQNENNIFVRAMGLNHSAEFTQAQEKLMTSIANHKLIQQADFIIQVEKIQLLQNVSEQLHEYLGVAENLHQEIIDLAHPNVAEDSSSFAAGEPDHAEFVHTPSSHAQSFDQHTPDNPAAFG